MMEIRVYGSMADAMYAWDPFSWDSEKCREDGYTANRTLVATRAALDGWFARGMHLL